MKKSLLAGLFLLSSLFASGQTSTLNRPNDPVVLPGSGLAAFSALSPAAIVGFKYVQGVWTQIPVQVDERALLDIVTPYGPIVAKSKYPPSPTNPKVYFYCDPTTYTGADPVAAFDADDELVFMARDAGGLFSGSAYPAGVVASSCRRVTITDPLGGTGYVYLFQQSGNLQPGAGTRYVTYTSNVAATAGFPANASGVNLENTSITTPKYTWHFSAEWVSDELTIASGSNTDLLDRYKNFFANGNCIRHEDAFSAGENAYVTVKAGPVRVIRSYMGAVSGPLTQRTHFFYEGRHDIATDLRVHNIVSIYDAFDYSPAASGMIYRNNLNTTGVTINGARDAVTAGDLTWEQVSGTPGTLSILHRRTTTLTASDARFTSYYDDNSAAPASNCTGDGQAWGTSGVGVQFLNGSVCTDPLGGGCGVSSRWYRTFQSRRTIYADPANGASTTASSYNNRLNNPLTTSIVACSGTQARLSSDDPAAAAALSDVRVFPNPGRGQLTISTRSACQLKVYNPVGQLVLTKQLTAGDNALYLPANGLFLFSFSRDGRPVRTLRHMLQQ